MKFWSKFEFRKKDPLPVYSFEIGIESQLFGDFLLVVVGQQQKPFIHG